MPIQNKNHRYLATCFSDNSCRERRLIWIGGEIQQRVEATTVKAETADKLDSVDDFDKGKVDEKAKQVDTKFKQTERLIGSLDGNNISKGELANLKNEFLGKVQQVDDAIATIDANSQDQLAKLEADLLVGLDALEKSLDQIEGSEYEARSGDTLGKLVEKHFGITVKDNPKKFFAAVMVLNNARGAGKNPDVLSVGEKINLQAAKAKIDALNSEAIEGGVAAYNEASGGRYEQAFLKNGWLKPVAEMGQPEAGKQDASQEKPQESAVGEQDTGQPIVEQLPTTIIQGEVNDNPASVDTPSRDQSGTNTETTDAESQAEQIDIADLNKLDRKVKLVEKLLIQLGQQKEQAEKMQESGNLFDYFSGQAGREQLEQSMDYTRMAINHAFTDLRFSINALRDQNIPSDLKPQFDQTIQNLKDLRAKEGLGDYFADGYDFSQDIQQMENRDQIEDNLSLTTAVGNHAWNFELGDVVTCLAEGTVGMAKAVYKTAKESAEFMYKAVSLTWNAERRAAIGKIIGGIAFYLANTPGETIAADYQKLFDKAVVAFNKEMQRVKDLPMDEQAEAIGKVVGMVLAMVVGAKGANQLRLIRKEAGGLRKLVNADKDAWKKAGEATKEAWKDGVKANKDAAKKWGERIGITVGKKNGAKLPDGQIKAPPEKIKAEIDPNLAQQQVEARMSEVKIRLKQLRKSGKKMSPAEKTELQELLAEQRGLKERVRELNEAKIKAKETDSNVPDQVSKPESQWMKSVGKELGDIVDQLSPFLRQRFLPAIRGLQENLFKLASASGKQALVLTKAVVEQVKSLQGRLSAIPDLQLRARLDRSLRSLRDRFERTFSSMDALAKKKARRANPEPVAAGVVDGAKKNLDIKLDFSDVTKAKESLTKMMADISARMKPRMDSFLDRVKKGMSGAKDNGRKLLADINAGGEKVINKLRGLKDQYPQYKVVLDEKIAEARTMLANAKEKVGKGLKEWNETRKSNRMKREIENRDGMIEPEFTGRNIGKSEKQVIKPESKVGVDAPKFKISEFATGRMEKGGSRAFRYEEPFDIQLGRELGERFTLKRQGDQFLLVDKNGRGFPLKQGENVIGRESRLTNNSHVSGEHANIEIDGDNIRIHDLDSSNGTELSAVGQSGNVAPPKETPARLREVPSARRNADSVPREKHLFQREAVEEIDSKYYKNSTEAGEYFDDFFHKQDSVSMSEFKKMNDEMHRISAVGREGNNAYYKDLEIGEIGTMQKRFSASSLRPEMDQYTKNVTDQLDIPRANLKVKVRGISDQANPKNVRTPEGMEHNYPGSQHYDEYFQKGADLLNQFKLTLKNKTGRITNRQIETISDYFHTMANVRPYKNINNSLFMNQVNYMLREAGHPGVAHAYIDHLAHRTTTEQFREIFKAHLNGQLSRPQDFLEKAA